MSINFGKYDQRVEILNYTQTRSSDGGELRVYSVLYTLWAKVTPVGGSETQQSEEKVANIISMTWRGKTFNITSIDEFGSRLNEGYKIRGTAKDND